MPRRFSDEPINLIRRIPTPEQLSAARPSKRALGQTIVESGAACVRGLAEVVAQFRKLGRVAQTALRGKSASGDPAVAPTNGPVTDTVDHLDEWVAKPDIAVQPRSSAASVQPEEVAELRAYVLSHQQDIARLSAQVQELKSLVVSQQQVLVFLGKELEAMSVSSVTAIASAPAKRSRAVREKPPMKDKAVTRKDVQKPSLSF